MQFGAHEVFLLQIQNVKSIIACLISVIVTFVAIQTCQFPLMIRRGSRHAIRVHSSL